MTAGGILISILQYIRSFSDRQATTLARLNTLFDQPFCSQTFLQSGACQLKVLQALAVLQTVGKRQSTHTV